MGCVAQNNGSARLFYLGILNCLQLKSILTKYYHLLAFVDLWKEAPVWFYFFLLFFFFFLLQWQNAHITAGTECPSSGGFIFKQCSHASRWGIWAVVQLATYSTSFVYSAYCFQIFAISTIMKCSKTSARPSALDLNFFTFKLDLLFLGRKIRILTLSYE